MTWKCVVNEIFLKVNNVLKGSPICVRSRVYGQERFIRNLKVLGKSSLESMGLGMFKL